MPHFDDADRAPCLHTGTPAPATTSAAIVDTLIEWAPSPPVPTMSIACARSSSVSGTSSCLFEHRVEQARQLCGVLALWLAAPPRTRRSAPTSPRPSGSSASPPTHRSRSGRVRRSGHRSAQATYVQGRWRARSSGGAYAFSVAGHRRLGGGERATGRRIRRCGDADGSVDDDHARSLHPTRRPSHAPTEHARDRPTRTEQPSHTDLAASAPSSSSG